MLGFSEFVHGLVTECFTQLQSEISESTGLFELIFYCRTLNAAPKIGGNIEAIEEENGGSSGGSATTASASETKLDITNFPKGPLFESTSAATNGAPTNGNNGSEASESLEEKCH